MQTLLSTKLTVPPARQALVLRPGLVGILAKARAHALTLVSAPPGYGKTTLVSGWLQECGLPFTWLSLDEGDNDPIRFLEYFLTALHAVVPGIRPDLLALLERQAAGSPAAAYEMLMALVINEAAGAGDFFIALDDVQALQAAPILAMLGYLLEHMPPGMHLVLLSRTDPPLPFARLRARGRLLEIRTEQLRFRAAEIAQFYAQVMNLALSAADVAAVEARTEGWIAGLQLAGLAMQTALVSPAGSTPASDAHSFIAAFTGSHAYIMDYLTEEVLRAQPDSVRSFLLQTAVLDRMCGELCEEVMGDALIGDPLIRDSVIRDSVSVIRDSSKTPASSGKTIDESRINESRINESRITESRINESRINESRITESRITESPIPASGQAVLEHLDRSHLFVIPLDSGRRWYRYHHLFKEVLRRRLEVLYPGEIPGLHRRASEWFEQNGYIHEAFQHALQAGDPDRTARLVEQHGCALLMGGELVTLAGWLAAIDPYTRNRPWLAMQKAWVLALSGQAEQAELVINAGEELVAALELTEEVRTLRGSFSAARALWANTLGKTDLAARYARQAIGLLREGGDFSCALRSVATSLLGDASWAQGKLEEARYAYEEAVQIGQMASNPHMILLSSASLADVHFEQGQLHQAARLYAEALRLAEQVDGPDSSYAQGVHFGWSRVLYAWNRLEEAAETVEQARRLALRWENEGLQAACLAHAVQIDLARGNLEQARSAAEALEGRVRERALSPHWSMWVKTALARFWLEQGTIERALFLLRDTGALPAAFAPETLALNGFPREAGIPDTSILDASLPDASLADVSLPDAPIPYRLVPAYILLARLLLKLGRPAAVLAVSERLVQEADTWGWGKALAELLVLQALAFQARQDTPCALAALEKAIALAWPEQSIRLFLDEGQAMGKLLYQARAHGAGGAFGEDLLALLDQHQARQAAAERAALPPAAQIPAGPEAGRGQRPPTAPEVQRGNSFLVEPLSARELEVLRCIAEGCSNQEIANRLVLSPLTVKRHISNIYAKLEAKSRTQAVSLARALRLIE